MALGISEFFAADQPNILHRDYWALRAIDRGLAAFFEGARTQLSGKQILDYGAGTSPYAPIAAAIGARLLPADIGKAQPGGVLIHPDGRIDLSDDSVDGLISTQVLEHVPDVAGYLNEAMRVLLPGAPMFLSTHGDWVLHRVPTDFRRWTIDGLRYECEKAGFEIESIESAVGILASSTHLRSSVAGRLLERSPLLSWLKPIVFLAANLRMGLEDLVTPAHAMATHPQLLLVTARKPLRG
jgi:SAM-dependent methyltransferase